MTGPLEIDRVAVTELSRRYGVRRLLVFGSAVRADFDEGTSDVDFLVEFHDNLPNRFDAYFGLKEALEALLGRPVDLVSRSAMENPYFAESVASTGQELHAPETPASLSNSPRP